MHPCTAPYKDITTTRADPVQFFSKRMYSILVGRYCRGRYSDMANYWGCLSEMTSGKNVIIVIRLGMGILPIFFFSPTVFMYLFIYTHYCGGGPSLGMDYFTKLIARLGRFPFRTCGSVLQHIPPSFSFFPPLHIMSTKSHVPTLLITTKRTVPLRHRKYRSKYLFREFKGTRTGL